MSRKEQILKLRNVLIKRRDALRKALAGDLSMLNKLRSEFAGDVVDAALDSAQNEISSQLAEVESRELANIEKAIQRFRNGTYGICEGCDGIIPIARLNALPYATFCINCQRATETSKNNSQLDGDWSRVLDTSYKDADVPLTDMEMH